MAKPDVDWIHSSSKGGHDQDPLPNINSDLNGVSSGVEMGSGYAQWRIDVDAAGDVLRRESQLRLLRDELSGLDGATAVIEPVAAPPHVEHKGGDVVNLTMLASVSVAGAARTLVAAIQAWCERERGRRVRIQDGGRSLEIDGRLDADAKRLVEKFLDGKDA